MVYSLSYRRPSRVSDGSSFTSANEKRVSREGSYLSGTSGSIKGIPEALSFDRIIAGGTCPVCIIDLICAKISHLTLSV
jgi:hypothetical protein